jgi:type IV secretion system protein TrbL
MGRGIPPRRTGWFTPKPILPTFHSIQTWLLAMGMLIGVVLAAVFFSIQYVMCIFEYFIVSMLGIIFIPFILWDGTKSYAAKLVTMFFGFFIKILVLVLCVYWTYGKGRWTGKALCQRVCAANSFVPTGTTCWVVTQNAPQIAMTMLSGNPQLSMGEFMRAAGTAAAGAVLAKRAWDRGAAGRQAAGQAVGRGAVTGVQSAAGTYAGMRAAGESRGSAILSAASAGTSAFGSTMGHEVKSAVQQKFTGTKAESAANTERQLGRAGEGTTGADKTYTTEDIRKNAYHNVVDPVQKNNEDVPKLPDLKNSPRKQSAAAEDFQKKWGAGQTEK